MSEQRHSAERDAVVCERVCEYAMDIGLPEYSGLTHRPQGCGNCAHYIKRACCESWADESHAATCHLPPADPTPPTEDRA